MSDAATIGGRSIAPLTTEQLARIASLIREDAGIHLPEEKKSLVSSRLGKRVRKLGLDSFEAYCDFVSSSSGFEERREMLHSLTTNVTRFFREEHHFEELRTDFLPSLLAEARLGKKIRIWSAGCSSGEEPYSIAMTILALEPDAPKMDIKILATDIDPNVLSIGVCGQYPLEAFEPAPRDLVNKHFVKSENDTLTASEQIRGMITFKILNLMADWPIKGPFDAIFCRNVIIYFEQSTQDRLIQRFSDMTRVESLLFLGHSERVSNSLINKFERSGFTSYKRI